MYLQRNLSVQELPERRVCKSSSVGKGFSTGINIHIWDVLLNVKSDEALHFSRYFLRLYKRILKAAEWKVKIRFISEKENLRILILKYTVIGIENYTDEYSTVSQAVAIYTSCELRSCHLSDANNRLLCAEDWSMSLYWLVLSLTIGNLLYICTVFPKLLSTTNILFTYGGMK